MTPHFTYEEGQLTISIPTADPQAFHAQLLKALNRSMKNYILSKDDSEAQLALVPLMDALLN